MSTDERRPLPAGFADAPKVETLDYANLSNGHTVKFLRTRQFTSEGTSYTMHRFDRDGHIFDIWGCNDLNTRLEAVPSGTVLFLRYEGKEITKRGREVHAFTVAVRAQPSKTPF